MSKLTQYWITTRYSKVHILWDLLYLWWDVLLGTHIRSIMTDWHVHDLSYIGCGEIFILRRCDWDNKICIPYLKPDVLEHSFNYIIAMTKSSRVWCTWALIQLHHCHDQNFKSLVYLSTHSITSLPWPKVQEFDVLEHSFNYIIAMTKSSRVWCTWALIQLHHCHDQKFKSLMYLSTHSITSLPWPKLQERNWRFDKTDIYSKSLVICTFLLCFIFPWLNNSCNVWCNCLTFSVCSGKYISWNMHRVLLCLVKLSHAQLSVGWNNLSILKLPQLRHQSLEIDR